jgi:hypothetical protein
VPSKLVQQLLNILQAANVEAIKVDRDKADSKPLTTSLLFADGATGDGTPLDPPSIYVGDYLVQFTAPGGGETALLTRAQAEVFLEFYDLGGPDVTTSGGTAPLGCCTDHNGQGKNNVTQSNCPSPPNLSWSQGACGG